MITTQDEIEILLRRWGYCFGETRPKDYGEDSSGSLVGSTANLLGGIHVGMTAMRTKRKMREFTDRNGVIRKEVAPILQRHGKETRTPGSSWNPPPELMEVEQAAIDLYHFNRLRGVVLRVEYCFRGMRHKERAARVGQFEGMEGHIGVRRYRYELDFARQFMAGKLCGKKAA